jgi:hypothetical protein
MGDEIDIVNSGALNAKDNTGWRSRNYQEIW